MILKSFVIGFTTLHLCFLPLLLELCLTSMVESLSLSFPSLVRAFSMISVCHFHTYHACIGFLLRGLSSIFIYTFLEHLPLAVFILEEIDCLFGGLGVYDLGVYGFAASITSTKDRAHVMARSGLTYYRATTDSKICSNSIDSMGLKVFHKSLELP